MGGGVTHLVSLGLTTWTHLVSLGLTWIHWASLGRTWTHLDSLGLTWSHLVSLGLTWTHFDSLGLTWSHLDSLGLKWIHLDSLGLTSSSVRFLWAKKLQSVLAQAQPQAYSTRNRNPELTRCRPTMAHTMKANKKSQNLAPTTDSSNSAPRLITSVASQQTNR